MLLSLRSRRNLLGTCRKSRCCSAENLKADLLSLGFLCGNIIGFHKEYILFNTAFSISNDGCDHTSCHHFRLDRRLDNPFDDLTDFRKRAATCSHSSVDIWYIYHTPSQMSLFHPQSWMYARAVVSPFYAMSFPNTGP